MDDDENRPGWAWNSLVVWILILATPVLVGGWLLAPYWFVQARPHGTNARSSCVANLKQLDGAKATWALEFKKQINDVPRDADLFGQAAYIREKPICPLGGQYTIGPVYAKPRCSVPGHTL